MQTRSNSDLAAISQNIWSHLQRASLDKHHEWRSPVFATNAAGTGADTWPDARTIILRRVDLEQKTLTFYTDSRSPKVAQLRCNPHATLVFWSKRLGWQLRVRATVDVITEGDLVEQAWAVVKQSPAANDYLSAEAPGNLLTSPGVAQHAAARGEPHFALLITHVQVIDWLALNRAGHQRARIDQTGVVAIVP